MIRILPPCSATNRRPPPSPAVVIARGLLSPLTNGSRRTATVAGSKRVPGVAEAVPAELRPGLGRAADADGPPGVAPDGEDGPGETLPGGVRTSVPQAKTMAVASARRPVPTPRP